MTAVLFVLGAGLWSAPPCVLRGNADVGLMVSVISSLARCDVRLTPEARPITVDGRL